MPTVLQSGPYRFFFYSGDRDEPRHVHVARDDCEAKFWLEPISLEREGGFPKNQLREIEKLIEENVETMVEKWNEHFGLPKNDDAGDAGPDQ